MASNTLCGTCGAVLAHPTAPCWRCGAMSTAGQFARPRKSPFLAAALAALVPGLGHVYVGEYKKGLGFLVATGALEFFGLDLDLTAIGLALGIPMELGGLGVWIYGVWDAYHAARRFS